jgi:hypothetical protein
LKKGYVILEEGIVDLINIGKDDPLDALLLRLGLGLHVRSSRIAIIT